MLDRLTWRIGFIAAAILAALLFVGFATQTIRIEGFNLWPLKFEGFKDANKRLRIDLDSVKSATEIADMKARAAKAAAEAEYRKKAEETDHAYKTALDDANARARRYFDRMRVKAPGGASGQPVTPANGSDAEGSDGSGEDAFVAISKRDFDAATENALRLQAAHDWACSQVGAKCE